MTRLLLRRQVLTYPMAENGVEALDVYKNCNPKYVLMDCQMPVMDGFEATKKLRELYGDEPRIFALTAAEILTESSWKEQGFDGFIAKPFRKNDIKRIFSDEQESKTAA